MWPLRKVVSRMHRHPFAPRGGERIQEKAFKLSARNPVRTDHERYNDSTINVRQIPKLAGSDGRRFVAGGGSEPDLARGTDSVNLQRWRAALRKRPETRDPSAL